MTPGDTAKLDTNEAASVCFRDPGYIRYMVRMEATTPTGELTVAGVVKVGLAGTSGQPTAGEMGSTTTTTTTTTTVPPNR